MTVADGEWHDVETWQELHVANVSIYLERRPAHCDRGRFVAKLFCQHYKPIHVDHQDGWPRYYFSEERAKAEIADWLAVRGIATKRNGHERTQD